MAGRGWIALALVVFATWRPLRVIVGAYLFGGVMIAQLFVQGSGMEIDMPSQVLSSLPYWATIVVLVIISRNASHHQAQCAGVAGPALSGGYLDAFGGERGSSGRLPKVQQWAGGSGRILTTWR